MQSKFIFTKSIQIAYAIIFALFITGCEKQQTTEKESLDAIEKILPSNPDSAQILLKNIHLTDNKNEDNLFAHWCLLTIKTADLLNNPISLTSKQCERAYQWLISKGSPDEATQILIYWGRRYASEGDSDEAMRKYTQALDIAQAHKLYNRMGYINSHMGDLYEQKDLCDYAVDKYKEAGHFFQMVGNSTSYAYALRDLGREYAFIGKLSQALETMQKADSLANIINDDNVKGTIANALGNIYRMSKQYDEAEKYFLTALKFNKNKEPDYIALIQIYLAQQDFNNAHKILTNFAEKDNSSNYAIHNIYYQLYKKEGKYQQALEKLEICHTLVDSVIHAENQSRILEIESNYQNLKIKAENGKLKIQQQSHIIFSIASICLALFIATCYFAYKKKMVEKLHKQESELSQIKSQLMELSAKLEQKQKILMNIHTSHENEIQLKNEIKLLRAQYNNLQRTILVNSSIYKKLSSLAKRNIPGNNQSLMTDELWKQVEDKIIHTYPNLKSYLLNLCANLTSKEWSYCCLYMFGFDSNEEAVLLNLNPNSVRTKHVRLRQKLQIILPPNYTLYDYIIENMN